MEKEACQINIVSQNELCPREKHRTLEFIGLRSHATTVGLIQLCEELLTAGILDGAALQRIKDAIRMELTVGNARISNQPTFDATLRRRLDAIFPHVADEDRTQVGTVEELEDALETYHGA